MRIVLVVPSFPKISETFIASKALGLVDRGSDVHIVCDRSEVSQWESFGAGHRVHELRDRVHTSPPIARRPSGAVAAAHRVALLRNDGPTLRRYASGGDEGRLRRAVAALTDAPLIALRPDVVHFEFGSLAVERMALRDRLGVALTVSFRGFDLNYVGLDRADHYREVWSTADGIHVLGQDLWRRALRRGAPQATQHTVISPAIDTGAISPQPSRPGPLGTAAAPLRVLSVGRLHWKKGYDHGLEAIAGLRSRGIAVEHRIVGDGDLLEAIGFWRHQLGLDDIVEFVGAVSPGAVAEHYRWADVLLHAATSEGFCNAVVEAQAHGVPVVTSDADGLAENVEHGVTGFVVARRDAVALTDRLEDLAADADLRSRVAEAGPTRVHERFRMEQQLDAWESFYQRAVARRRRAP